MPGRNLFADEVPTPATTGRNLFANAPAAPTTQAAPVGMPTLESIRGAAIGIPDVALSMARGMVNKPAASLVGAASWLVNPTQDTYTKARDDYRRFIDSGQGIVQPEGTRTPEGARLAQGIAQGMSYTGLPWLANKAGQGLEAVGGPALRDFGGSAAELASLGAPGILGRLQAKPVPVLGFDKQSIGASSASPVASAMNASPAMQQAVNALTTRGKSVHPEVLERHLEADSLPVPIRLTEGQATQDPVILSNEKNMRAKHEALAQHFNEQHQQLVDNVQTVRDQVGPQVFSTNPVEHGDTLIAAYKAKDAVAEAHIGDLYKQLRTESGSGVPIDAQTLLKNATAKLHADLLFDHAPPEIMKTLERLAESKTMTFENFESLRTNLAAIQRSSADGNVKRAAGVIRNTLEDLPLMPGSGAARMKPIADAARQAARERFKAMEADPAYKAAVEDSVPPDRFVQKFIISAPRDSVTVMRQNLAGNEAALQTMGVSALDHLRQSAGVDLMGNGSLSQARFNKVLASLSPKLPDLVPTSAAQTLQDIGNVARHIQNQPAGSFVNNSNTFVAAAGKSAADIAEGAANFAAYGVPVGTMTRRALEGRAGRKAVQQSLRPGAGLERKH